MRSSLLAIGLLIAVPAHGQANPQGTFHQKSEVSGMADPSRIRTASRQAFRKTPSRSIGRSLSTGERSPTRRRSTRPCVAADAFSQ